MISALAKLCSGWNVMPGTFETTSGEGAATTDTILPAHEPFLPISDFKTLLVE